VEGTAISWRYPLALAPIKRQPLDINCRVAHHDQLAEKHKKTARDLEFRATFPATNYRFRLLNESELLMFD
jgi:hypothetical protein